MKKSLFLALALFLMTGMVFAGGGQEKGGKKVLTLGHVVMPETTLNQAALKFKEIVEKESGGSIIVEVHPAAALGSNREVIEGLQSGTIALTAPSIAPVSQFTDATALFDLPFLFSTQDYAQKVMQGEIGKSILAELDSAGLKGLCYWTQGYRHVTNSRNPIKKVVDLKGLKVRTMQNPAHIDLFNTMGASATPMAFSEVFTALQQKTIDGQENPYENIKLSGFAEVQQYICETGHIYDPIVLMISKAVWDTLTDSEQEIVQKAAEEARDYQLAILAAAETKIKDSFKGTNTIIEASEIDMKEMMMATVPVYKKYLDKAKPERVKAVLEMQDDYGKDLIEALGL